MTIEATVFDTHAALQLKGDFETEDAGTLLELVDELRAEGTKRVAMSLRFVKYINSTALGSMVRVREQLRDAGGDFVIVNPSSITREVMTKMGLDALIPMFDDEQAALLHLVRGSDPEGPARPAQPAAEDLEATVVLFSFDDDRSKMFTGRLRRGVGKIVSVDSHKIVFTWDAAGHGLGEDETTKMFAPRSSIQLKFQIKLLRKDRFGVDARIAGYAAGEGGDVRVTAVFSEIDASDKSALQRFAKDMAYLRRQVSDKSE